jgi:hypothetical protein
MILWDIVFAVGISLVFTVIFAGLFRRRGPWSNVFVFLAVIFLASWTGGVWLAPIGPSLYGVYWVPFVILGFLFALILAAAVPASPSKRRKAYSKEQAEVVTRTTSIDLFFIFLLVALAVAIFVGYLVKI